MMAGVHRIPFLLCRIRRQLRNPTKKTNYITPEQIYSFFILGGVFFKNNKESLNQPGCCYHAGVN